MDNYFRHHLGLYWDTDKKTNEDDQALAIQLFNAQIALESISPFLGSEGNKAIPLGTYLASIGSDMLEHKMSPSETAAFQHFVRTAGPYINKHVAIGIEWNSVNIEKVMDTLYSDIPAEYLHAYFPGA